MEEDSTSCGHPEAGPSSLPTTRNSTPVPTVIQEDRTLRRPASYGRLAQLMIPGRSRSSSTASQPEIISHIDTSKTSGRSTPEQRRRNGKAAATSLLANDAKYKKYALQVDRCLQSFESVNEWADFISFLSRLLKTLQIPTPPYTEIPKKLIVAKRLAQCLNPALPSGVHQRALDVYAYIFGNIGIEGLKRDLLIWSSGLFPFFQYATTSVRPVLINLYEAFYLPLGEALRPAVKAFTLALLPGMEEESGDFFDRILSLLSRVSENFPPAFFLSNIYLILISTPSARLAALNYLSRRHLKPPDSVETAGHVDLGLLIRGVAAVLNDENILVRRNGLDLLLRTFKLDEGILQQADEEDQRMLVRAAIGVVLQREMSLSRRVYTWLLGSDETSDGQIQHFKQHGLAPVVSTLEADMASPTSPLDTVDQLKPFKVFLSLLDKWEIGGLLSDKLALPAIQAIKILAQSDSAQKDEILMTASAVYDAIEPIVIWKSMFDGLIRGDSARKKDSRAIVLWLLTALPQKDEEVSVIHVPVMLQAILDFTSLDVDLVTQLFSAIPDSAFSVPLATQRSTDPEGDLATALYSGKTADIDSVRGMVSGQVIPAIISKLFSVSMVMRRESHSSVSATFTILGICSQIIDKEAKALQAVDGVAWMASLITALEEVDSFLIVDAILSVALKASQCTGFRPVPDIRSGSTLTSVLHSLLLFLCPAYAAYHVRVVRLIWEFYQFAEVHTLENVLARQLASDKRSSALQAFGVLWRLTDDAVLPGELFFTPILGILDDLESRDPEFKSCAETWIRCNVRSYFRVIDPILSRLLDPNVRIVDRRYQGTIDLSYIRYLIERLVTLFKFGGQGLSKACQVTEVAKSPHLIMVERSKLATVYTDLLMAIMIRHMTTETNPSRLKQDEKAVLGVQAASLDLLQHLVSRGDVSSSTLDSMKVEIVNKLDVSVTIGSLSLQSKLLHLLHSAITASAGTARRTHRKTTSTSSITEKEFAPGFETSLVRSIIRAISTASTRPVLQHWVDFILMTAPQLQEHRHLLEQLSEGLSVQLRGMMFELRRVYIDNASSGAGTAVSEAEPIMLLNALDRLVSLLSTSSARRSEESGRAGAEGGSSILGLVSGVFAAETPAGNVQTAGGQYLDHAVEALLVLWSVTSTPISDGPARSTGEQVFTRIQARGGKVLDRLFKAVPESVITHCISIWAENSRDVTDVALFGCIDAHTPSAQKVVEYISKVANSRNAVIAPESNVDPAVLAFLEAYLQRLEAPIAVQVWSTMFSFAKDILAVMTTPSARNQLYPLLRCLTTLANTVASTSALEDKRLRRDLQDVYAKVLDLVVTNTPKIAESALWKRATEVDKPEFVNGHAINEGPNSEGVKRIYEYISSLILPNLRTFLHDTDRIAAVCTVISANMVVPALRKQEVDETVLGVLKGLTSIPAATKAWKIQVGEVFNDPKFFKLGKAQVGGWKSVISSLMDSDKERFGELLSRITAAPSANIFTNREQEMIIRSLNLRRLSFVLLAAERNHYLTQLPSIQEKLVDILRTNVVSPKVHSEVYLCLRVLMCRVGAQHLTNFWPVILTELLRVFESTMDESTPDGSESLQLILAACKFLDLLLVMQSEDFQIHQWMFITDTVDAGYPPEENDTEALMDRLSEILMEHSHTLHLETPIPIRTEDDAKIRRPHLSEIRNLTSLYQLQPFFSRASTDTFEGIYGDVAVDWEAVEQGFDLEIFDA